MLEALVEPQDIIDAAGGDMYLRVAAAGGVVGRAWTADGAVIWAHTHHGQPGLAGVGPPRAAADLLVAVLAEVPDVRRVSLPRGWLDHARHELLQPGEVSDWDWMWTTDPPPAARGEDSTRWLAATDADDIRALLEQVSPGASVWPGDSRARRWAGIRDARGRLVACLADTSRSADVGHFSSVATAADTRRQGHGLAVTSWVTRRFLAEGRWPVTLGMYADNAAARAMYRRLGFRCEHTFTAAALGPRTAPDAATDRCPEHA